MLRGKSVLVCGSGSHIGETIIQSALVNGASVVALGRTLSGSFANKVSLFVLCDMSSEADILRAFKEVRRTHHRLDAAVHCAGMTIRKPFCEHTTSEWDMILNVNLRSVWLCMQQEFLMMRELRSGSIVNIASVAGLRANDWGETPYVVSKHGLIGLTRAATAEFGTYNIRVNALCPSIINDEMTKGLFSDDAIYSRLAQKHPVHRLCTAQDVANAAVWLCSDASNFVSGVALPIDGGLTAK